MVMYLVEYLVKERSELFWTKMHEKVFLEGDEFKFNAGKKIVVKMSYSENWTRRKYHAPKFNAAKIPCGEISGGKISCGENFPRGNFLH